MAPRPLVLVSGLTAGDYLLWTWSLNGNHSVLALIAGLTLPPLAVAVLWLLALSIAGAIATFLEHPARRARSARKRLRGRGRQPTVSASAVEDAQASTAAAGADSRKLAA